MEEDPKLPESYFSAKVVPFLCKIGYHTILPILVVFLGSLFIGFIYPESVAFQVAAWLIAPGVIVFFGALIHLATVGPKPPKGGWEHYDR